MERRDGMDVFPEVYLTSLCALQIEASGAVLVNRLHKASVTKQVRRR